MIPETIQMWLKVSRGEIHENRWKAKQFLGKRFMANFQERNKLLTKLM